MTPQQLRRQSRCVKLAHRLRSDGERYLAELAKCSSLHNQAAAEDILEPISDLIRFIGHGSETEREPALAVITD